MAFLFACIMLSYKPDNFSGFVNEGMPEFDYINSQSHDDVIYGCKLR